MWPPGPGLQASHSQHAVADSKEKNAELFPATSSCVLWISNDLAALGNYMLSDATFVHSVWHCGCNKATKTKQWQRVGQSTMIHSGTLCIQWKVMKFPCFGGLVFRAQFQDFLSAFWRSFFDMQLALVSMITITPTLSLSVFSLQRTRLFLTCGELWRTCGELWLYFEMQRRLDLWSFSWSSRRSREAQKWA